MATIKSFEDIIAWQKARELKSQLYAAFDVESISEEEFKRLTVLADEVSKLIQGFKTYLANKSAN